MELGRASVVLARSEQRRRFSMKFNAIVQLTAMLLHRLNTTLGEEE
jgi:hypothetical protein